MQIFLKSGKPDPAKVELGTLLFLDKILSGNGNLPSATRHHPFAGIGIGIGLIWRVRDPDSGGKLLSTYRRGAIFDVLEPEGVLNNDLACLQRLVGGLLDLARTVREVG